MKLNEKNFPLFAARHYDNISCYGVDEFNEDLNRIKYLKRLFGKYDRTGEIDDHTIRLILNHLITLYNVFDVPACTQMLKFKMPEYLVYLKPFLMYLKNWDLDTDGVIMDDEIIRKLRKI